MTKNRPGFDPGFKSDPLKESIWKPASGDTPNGTPKNTPKDNPKGSPAGTPKDGPKAIPKDTPKDNPEGATKDIPLPPKPKQKTINKDVHVYYDQGEHARIKRALKKLNTDSISDLVRTATKYYLDVLEID